MISRGLQVIVFLCVMLFFFSRTRDDGWEKLTFLVLIVRGCVRSMEYLTGT